MELNVAVVGTGPAGMYTIGHLLERAPETVRRISVLDRLPTPGGLVRAGVAPDHPRTKKVQDVFNRSLRDPRVHCYLNVDVGTDVTHQDLVDHHHAVVYAVGAGASRALGIPGEDLPGCHAAADFVAWYNGHPDLADAEFDLQHRRVVIVGSGNVALDVARILTAPVENLRGTDIADHALRALAASAVEEVVVLARGGAASAAFTSAELLALSQLDDVDIVVAADLDDVDEPTSYASHLKICLLREIAARPLRGHRRRILLQFMTSPTAILGSASVTGVEVAGNAVRGQRLVMSEDRHTLETGLVLRSIGYEVSPLPGLPFDEQRRVVPNEHGRISPGVYVAGWFKRGPTGVIGTNKYDAMDTVESLLADGAAGLLTSPAGEFVEVIGSRCRDVVTMEGWSRIDEFERRAAGRPRTKLTDRREMLRIARTGP